MNTNLSKNNTLFLVLVLIAITISTTLPITSFAQTYYSEQQEYYTEDPYDKYHKKLLNYSKQQV
ncbi:MAG: hypothetical protein MRJ93_06890 [Nitrososphaeraceae archaeon]|nr:hypothetical protein [Nitrososphaeraceae archaeon]